MFSQEKINRLLIIMTCVILMGGLYYEHYMLKLKSGLKRQEKQVVQQKLALQKHVRKSSVNTTQTNNKSNDNMLSLKMGSEQSGRDISLSLDSGLSSSLKAFKSYTRSLESEAGGDL